VEGIQCQLIDTHSSNLRQVEFAADCTFAVAIAQKDGIGRSIVALMESQQATSYNTVRDAEFVAAVN
jgi:hypothetical protein